MSEDFGKKGENLKRALRAMRDELRLTNQAVADRAGLPANTVANYFSGRSRDGSAITVGQMCTALNVSFDQIFGITPAKAENSEATKRIHELEAENSQQAEEIARKDNELARKDNTIAQQTEEITRQAVQIEHLATIQEMQTKQISNMRMTHIFLVGLYLFVTIALTGYIIIDATDLLHGFIRDGELSPGAFVIFGLLIISALMIGWSLVRFVRGK